MNSLPLKKLLIGGLVFFVILDLVLVSIYFTKSSRFKLPSFLREEKPTEQVALPTPSPPLSFASPVKNEYLQTIPEYAKNSNHLVFFLPAQTPIYAIFSGKVFYVGQKITEGKVEFENIIIKKENEGMTASYLLATGSEILVKENDLVSEGALIAKTKSGTGPGCLGGGNLGVYLFRNGEPARLTKEMIRNF